MGGVGGEWPRLRGSMPCLVDHLWAMLTRVLLLAVC